MNKHQLRNSRSVFIAFGIVAGAVLLKPASVAWARQSSPPYPVQSSEIDASITGTDRQLLEDAMGLVPPSERENFILITADDTLLANKLNLTQDWVRLSVTAPLPPPEDDEDPESGESSSGGSGETTSTSGGSTGGTGGGSTSSTTGSSTGTTTGTNSGLTTGETTTGSTTGSSTGTTGSETGSTGSSTTGSETGGTTGETTGSTTNGGNGGETGGGSGGETTGSVEQTAGGGSNTRPMDTLSVAGCDCATGVLGNSGLSTTDRDSGPYRRTVLKAGVCTKLVTTVELPGRNGLPLTDPDAYVNSDEFMEKDGNGNLLETGNPNIYLGGWGQNNSYFDAGLQCSGIANRYQLFFSRGTYRWQLPDGSTNIAGHFAMETIVAMNLRGETGNRVVFFVSGAHAQGGPLSLTVMGNDSAAGNWSPALTGARLKYVTSIAQSWQGSNADVPDQAAWICEAGWIAQIVVNGTQRPVAKADKGSVDNYPDASVRTGGGFSIESPWENPAIKVEKANESTEIVSIDLRRDR